MKPITAIERFVAPDADECKQMIPADDAPVLPSGAIGHFFVLNPINVQHPSVTPQVVKTETVINVARYGRIYKRKKHSPGLGRSRIIIILPQLLTEACVAKGGSPLLPLPATDTVVSAQSRAPRASFTRTSSGSSVASTTTSACASVLRFLQLSRKTSSLACYLLPAIKQQHTSAQKTAG